MKTCQYESQACLWAEKRRKEKLRVREGKKDRENGSRARPGEEWGRTSGDPGRDRVLRRGGRGESERQEWGNACPFFIFNFNGKKVTGT